MDLLCTVRYLPRNTLRCHSCTALQYVAGLNSLLAAVAAFSADHVAALSSLHVTRYQCRVRIALNPKPQQPVLTIIRVHAPKCAMLLVVERDTMLGMVRNDSISLTAPIACIRYCSRVQAVPRPPHALRARGPPRGMHMKCSMALHSLHHASPNSDMRYLKEVLFHGPMVRQLALHFTLQGLSCVCPTQAAQYFIPDMVANAVQRCCRVKPPV